MSCGCRPITVGHCCVTKSNDTYISIEEKNRKEDINLGNYNAQHQIQSYHVDIIGHIFVVPFISTLDHHLEHYSNSIESSFIGFKYLA